jgi:hypothetical protein
MSANIFDHTQQTWDHVLNGNSTLAEKLECGAEAVLAAVVIAAAFKYGGARCLSTAERFLPQIASLTEAEATSAASLLRRGTMAEAGALGLEKAGSAALAERATAGQLLEGSLPKMTIGGTEATLLSKEETSRLYAELAAKNEYVFVKKPYVVSIRDGVSGETVIDIQGKPQAVGDNMKVVRRVFDDGKIDTYPIDIDTFAARWQSAGANVGEYIPRPVPTKMVLLDRAVTIPGHTGNQLGLSGEMLAHDPAKGTFWTVQKEPMLTTYIGNDEKSRALLKLLSAGP